MLKNLRLLRWYDNLGFKVNFINSKFMGIIYLDI